MIAKGSSEASGWRLVGLRRSEKGWHIGAGRAIDEHEVNELQAKFDFVTELAEQEEFQRFIGSGRRLAEIFARGAEELEEDDVLSKRTQAATRDELLAASKLAVGLERHLAGDLKQRYGPVDARAQRFEATRARIRSSPPMLLFTNAAAPEAGAPLVAVDGTLFFASVLSTPAWEVILGGTGVLAALVRAHLEAVRDEFRPIYEEVKKIADAVTDGYPTLVYLRIDEETDEVSGLQLKSVPFHEAEAIRQILSQRAGALPTVEQVQAMAVALESVRLEQHLRFGGTSASHSVVGGNVHEGIEQPSSAEIELDRDLLGSVPIDYWSPVTYVLEQGPMRQQRLRGSVQKAKQAGAKLVVDVEDAVELSEHTAHGMLVEGMSPEEVITSLIRQSGLPSETIRMEHPPESGEQEVFEVFAGLRGISANEEIPVGDCSLARREVGLDAVTGFTLGEDEAGGARLIEEFRHADSYLRARIETNEIDFAEDEGLARARTSVAWLVVRGRFGEASLPNGEVQRFERELSMRVAEMGPVVLVRGISSGRRWLRWPSGRGEPAHQAIERGSLSLTPPLPADVGGSTRQGLLALERAVRETDPLAQVQALWQGIEAYVAGTKARKRLFSSTQLDSIRKSLSDDWTPREMKKLNWALGMLNEPSAREMLRWRLRRDDVRITDEELTVLMNLREVRNDIVHGRPVKEPPRAEAINQSIGLVARMLVQRIAGMATENSY